MKVRKHLKFLPTRAWLSPLNGGEYPIYMVPFYYCKRNGKIIMYWRLNWHHFSALLYGKNMFVIDRFTYFFHLKLNLITIAFLPYILVNNYLNTGKTGLIDYSKDL